MSRTAEQVQAETVNYMGVVIVVGLAILGAIWFIGWFGYDIGERAAYRQFATGQATVITYTVPGAGTCRAVLVDGKRHGETCEGEE